VMRDVIRRVNREDFRVVSGEDGRRTVRAIQLIYGRCTAKVRTHVPTVADPRASPVAVPAS
jgi:hypothetical protein